MTSVGHQTATGWLLHTLDGHRTIFAQNLNRTIQTGIQQCLTSARNIKKSLIKLADARPGTGRCFVSQTATGEKRRVFAEVHIASL